MLNNGDTVRINLTWYLDHYGHTEKNLDLVFKSGHMEVGEIHDSWIEVDGDRVYDVLCHGDLVVRGAYGEKDLDVL